MSIVNHGEIFNAIENWAPKSLAYQWDNVGLQIGSRNQQTKNIMTTLDVTEKVVNEAIEKNVNLIIAHHPLIFKSLTHINLETWKGKIIQKLLANNITVYVSHTNFDIANGGMNDILCQKLSIQSPKLLVETFKENLFKLIVYVPVTNVDEVRKALGDAGAGHIGQYSHCSFQSAGTGTFRPLEGTNPHIGETFKQTFVDEMKLEMIVNEINISSIISVLKDAHPYEEVAYDLIKLANDGQRYGLGRIGYLHDKMTFRALLDKINATFPLNQLRFVGDLDQIVNKIAVLAGSGEKYIDQAILKGADVFITGDVTYHHAQEAAEKGLLLIDPGHYIEEIMKESMKNYLHNYFPKLIVYSSKVNTDPFKNFSWE